jgi:hypothetical protein
MYITSYITSIHNIYGIVKYISYYNQVLSLKMAFIAEKNVADDYV